MGRWSRQLAPRFVAWLGAPPGLHWLDVGCGTGALTATIGQMAAPASVTGCDPSTSFVEYARSQHADGHISFVVGGTERLPHRPGGFGSVTSSLALNFFPDPAAAVADMSQVAALNGIVSACVWDYAGRMDFLRRFWDVAVELDADAKELDEGQRFALCQRTPLEALFRRVGLQSVRSGCLDITTTFASFDEYWTPFLGGTGPAPSYVASLTPAHRAALADALRRVVAPEGTSSLSMIARAWAVCGIHE